MEAVEANTMAIESMTSRMISSTDNTSPRVNRESRNDAMRVILEVVQGPLKGRSFVFDRHDTFIVVVRGSCIAPCLKTWHLTRSLHD